MKRVYEIGPYVCLGFYTVQLSTVSSGIQMDPLYLAAPLHVPPVYMLSFLTGLWITEMTDGFALLM